MELDQIKLTDLIAVPMLQKIQDAFANATGMAALTVDLDGAVTQLSNPTEFCMKLTRGCPKGAQRCNQCDLKGGEEAGRTGQPSVYYCHGGLMDFAAPILLGKKQIGSMIGGQVLPSPPDEGKFRRIAHEIGVDENAYIRALSKIKIVPKQTIESSAQLLYVMANALSDVGYQKYITRFLAEKLLAVSEEMRGRVGTVLENVQVIQERNTLLVGKIDHLVNSAEKSKNDVEKTDEVVKYISSVSMQTKLLGFNASVEASRANANGKGFGVIAQEIRRLAEQSQSQSGRIEDTICSVKNGILDISKQMIETYEAVRGNSSALVDILSAVEEIKDCAHQLKKLGKQL